MFKRALFGNKLPHNYYDLSNNKKVLALIEKDARISELEAIIEMLPHGDECLLVFNTITDRWEIET